MTMKQVREINQESRPKAGGTQNKKESAEDSQRKGTKPPVDNNVLDAVISPKGTASKNAVAQNKNSHRKFWVPAN
jgi:hypothetical protein